MDYTAVILAGGDARRLGGVDKPRVPVAGEPMLVRVLRSVDGASARVVVGPPELRALVPAHTGLAQERPPGGGPVAAVAAAFQQARPSTELTAILAGDLPLLTATAIERLRKAAWGADGAVYVDETGREQWLCGVWRTAAVMSRLDDIEHAGASLRRLFQGLDFQTVADPSGMPPWFDCDTADDIKQAEEWLTR